MNLLVFGATGATGRQIVSQALSRGHSVVAFVRDRSKMNLSDANLAVIEGDIQSVASIRNAFSGHVDAVISALGVFHRDPRTELSDGTRNLLQVAEEKNVTRFIVITSLGVGDSRGQGNLSARLFQKFMLAEVLADK